MFADQSQSDHRPELLSPIDIHCHGVGSYDFARPMDLDFVAINARLHAKRLRAILTLFVDRTMLSELVETCRGFQTLVAHGEVPNILGLALEGPLTSTPGGTPSRCHWVPSCDEWNTLASLGRCGLRYIVLSPDADPNPTATQRYPKSIGWIVELLLDLSVMPALGHFSKLNPEASARTVDQVLNIVARRQQGPIFTDHLFNDMPLAFKHAWRTREELASRNGDISDLAMETWTRANLAQKLGPVPAALIEGAYAGLVRISMNFDGAHVDHAICKRIVKILGSDRIMLMTDNITADVIDGTTLVKSATSPLLYQPNGVVAGSGSDAWVQAGNMARMGFSHFDIYWLCQGTAEVALGINASGPHDEQ